MNQKTSLFRCKCGETKTHCLTYDGGSSGQYVLELCQSCYSEEDRQFVISEEEIKI